MTADKYGNVCDICKGQYNLVDDVDGEGCGPWVGYQPFAVNCQIEEYKGKYWIIGGYQSLYCEYRFGAFVFNDDPPEAYKQKDIRICDVCVRELISYNKVQHHPALPAVICQVCNGHFRRITPFLHSEQGDDCAAHGFVSANGFISDDIAGWLSGGGKIAEPGDYLIKGCYGSTKFDCDVWRFKRERPEAYREAVDPICDNCIQELIDNDMIELIPGQYP